MDKDTAVLNRRTLLTGLAAVAVAPSLPRVIGKHPALAMPYTSFMATPGERVMIQHWNCRCVIDIIADEWSQRLHGAFVETVTDVFAESNGR